MIKLKFPIVFMFLQSLYGMGYLQNQFDIIIKLNNTAILGKVLKVTDNTVEFDPQGNIPFIIILRDSIDMIVYSDGTIKKMETIDNQSNYFEKENCLSDSTHSDADNSIFSFNHVNYKNLIKDTLSADITQWVNIKGGQFIMGDLFEDYNDVNNPSHSVILDSFALSVTEVTVAQYKKYCIATGKTMPPEPIEGWSDHYPIVNVSWDDAEEYCKWVGGRLPTEAEWEYAAREGGRFLLFGNGKNIADPNEIAFNGEEYGKDEYSVVGKTYEKPQPVGSFKPNRLNLYDMSGNVSEWCSDWYSENYYSKSPLRNPKGPSKGNYKSVRGGEYWNIPYDCLTTSRSYAATSERSFSRGFRVAKTIYPTKVK